MAHIGRPRVGDDAVRRPRVREELLELVRPDVGQDAAIVLLPEEPRRARLRREVVGRKVQHLQHATDRAL